ncbi:putative bifunctional diguanylate cyclase/phosphodiesterase [Erythrobacter sp.]|uniref:putative bifunctional diguanylate cyclase/phosphodiesterase n=1 Tax=Erythrobacter sp. TaxID=1042 RepID=UPI002EBAA8D4|nr:EAL domain-containing protein [Erythrobacter sp.]
MGRSNRATNNQTPGEIWADVPEAARGSSPYFSSGMALGDGVSYPRSEDSRSDKPKHDILTLGIAAAAIILFVAIGGAVLPDAIAALLGRGAPPEPLLVQALLLNIALIMLGWRRYRDLQAEIGERRRAEAAARTLADIDELTGCLNRRSMTQATEDLHRRVSARGMALAYCMIDLDNFKQINDMHGHAMGDATLIEFARRIRSELPRDARLARLGGDEFAFVTPYDPAQSERIDDLVLRIFQAMSLPFDTGGMSLDATISIGVASDHDDAGERLQGAISDTLMMRSDIAMYHAKKHGKNRYFWFEPTMENELRFRNELETGIRLGLERREFVPYYEQQVDIDTGDLVGFEMLARWQSPQLGIVSPEIFIPIAEEMGLIGELSGQLMNRAFVDALEWDDALTLSINISPLQLRDPWFAQKLLKMLVQHGFPPSRLEIEITESCLHENIQLVNSMIVSLRNQGVRVSLDDFGTGYSSLTQLRTLPFDRLKIDRSFISELRRSEPDSKIVNAIVSLGRGLQMPITVEGIEDEAILEALRKMGKLKGQGYFYGKPETAQQVRERLNLLGLLGSRAQNKDSSNGGGSVAADDATQPASISIKSRAG